MRVPFLFLSKHEACSPDKRVCVITSFLPREGRRSSTNPGFAAGGYSTPTALPPTESFGTPGTSMPTLTAQGFNTHRGLCLLSGLWGALRVLPHSPTSLPVHTVTTPKTQGISALQQDHPKTFHLNTENV